MSHLSLLQTRASTHPHAPVFKLPQLDARGNVFDWSPITYSQFYLDVERFGRYWAKTLEVPSGSVVGMWISGLSYVDAVNIYGVSRAGFIPQLFSLRLPNPTVVQELLEKTDARALICDPSFESILNSISLPSYRPCTDLATDAPEVILPDYTAPDLTTTAFIFHTSGSTSGSPKLVSCSYRWIEAAINKAGEAHSPYNPDVQDVAVWMGSMCHIGQTCTLLGHMARASCLIQPSKIAFSSEELVVMIQRGGLNRLCQFAAFLSNHLRQARADTRLLSMLVALDEVLYAGMPLPAEDETFARSNGINLVNLFGSTECGPMMKSVGGKGPHAGLLRPLKDTSYRFIPVNPVEEGQHQSTAQLLELVITSESPDCPHLSLRNSDGHFHTGDLFQEVTEGAYLPRGRDDDWIKTETSLRCDTKSIEDHVKQTCGQFVSECLVAGAGRPSPCLFIETTSTMEPAKLAKEIIRRTRAFNQRRYLHERISAHLIVIVPSNTLPRTATKGNIRRKAVEETFRTQMDQLYAKAR